MKRTVMKLIPAAVAIVLGILFLLITSGCSDTLRFSPSERQKEAADIAVVDIAALRPHVAPEAEPTRAEAELAAKVTQAYIGLPKKRAVPLAPGNAQAMAEAAEVATERPTTGEVVTEGVTVLNGILGSLATIAGIWGIRGAVKARQWQDKAVTTSNAIIETVKAIENVKPKLEPGDAIILRDELSKAQSPETKVEIAVIRKE